MASTSPTAAFFRIEGTLIARGACSAAAYFAANGAGFAERAWKLGQVALTAPIYSVLGQSDRVLANRLAYLPLRNMSEDRVAVLAEEYFDGVLRDRVLQGGVELMRDARRKGRRVVLISDGLAQVIEPLAAHLRHVDDFVCNRLEFRDGYATGKLIEPVVGGHDSASWVRRYAERARHRPAALGRVRRARARHVADDRGRQRVRGQSRLHLAPRGAPVRLADPRLRCLTRARSRFGVRSPASTCCSPARPAFSARCGSR